MSSPRRPSPPAAAGEPPSHRNAAATASTTASATPSGGKSLGQGLDLIMADLRLGRLAGRQELLVHQQLRETETRPHLRRAPVGPLEIVLAADHSGRRLIAKIVRAKAPKADHLVHDQTRRHL